MDTCNLLFVFFTFLSCIDKNIIFKVLNLICL